jgi:hypothetical protein
LPNGGPMLKVLILFFALTAQSFASNIYSLQFGMGAESCHPNNDGLTECRGFSPQSKPISIELIETADGGTFYGYHTQVGTFEKIGFRASLTVIRFEGKNIDDMLKIRLQTWKLENPEQKTETNSEVFTKNAEDLNRMNIIATSIGTEEDYSTVILGIDHI